MLQQRKKDYLQRLIEEISKKLQLLIDNGREGDEEEKQKLLNECQSFFQANFDISFSEDSKSAIEKIDDFELLEQYAQLLMTIYDLSETKDRKQLEDTLSIVQYIESVDKTYSWQRTVLREDLLNRLG